MDTQSGEWSRWELGQETGVSLVCTKNQPCQGLATCNFRQQRLNTWFPNARPDVGDWRPLMPYNFNLNAVVVIGIHTVLGVDHHLTTLTFCHDPIHRDAFGHEVSPDGFGS